jgi:hypothetical protein
MAASYRAQFLSLLRQNEADMTLLFSRLSRELSGILAAAVDGPDQTISPFRHQAVRERAQAAVTRTFLVRGSAGDLKPFEVRAGTVIPTSPYMQVLWRNIQAGTRLAVERHRDEIARRLRKAPRVLARMQRATGNPFTEAQKVSEQLVWRPRPFATYDPAHLWVDPNGYRLSDRIWRTTVDTRRRIDLFIEQGLRDGRSAFDMARDIETFLQPGRQLIRTEIYGKDASFDAMRLARTEITRAHARADSMAANSNPFTDTYDVVLSSSHRITDICDQMAAGGPYPKTDTSHLPPFHPQCMDSIRWNTVSNASEIIGELQAEVDKQRSLLLDLVGPMVMDRFVQMLLGQAEFIFPPEALPFPS